MNTPKKQNHMGKSRTCGKKSKDILTEGRCGHFFFFFFLATKWWWSYMNSKGCVHLFSAMQTTLLNFAESLSLWAKDNSGWELIHHVPWRGEQWKLSNKGDKKANTPFLVNIIEHRCVLYYMSPNYLQTTLFETSPKNSLLLNRKRVLSEVSKSFT